MMKNWTYVLMATMILFGCEKSEMSENEAHWKETTVIPFAITNEREILSYIDRNPNLMELITLKELVKHTPTIQKQIMHYVSPNKRHSIWQEKLDFLLSKEWKIQEREHIVHLKRRLTVDIFSRNEAKLILLNDFSEKWVAEAQDNLGWSWELIEMMTMSYSLNYDDYIHTLANNSLVNGRDSCSCSTVSTWCGGKSCGGSCVGSCYFFNCGFLLAYCCDGICGRQSVYSM